MNGQCTLRWLLRAASVNNVLGGLVLIFWPVLPFRLAHLSAPIYPELVQAAGMFIALFGLAYALASLDPIRHWPVVLSGLAGKVFGTLGFIHYANNGRLPWSAAWIVLFIDVIWWVPLGLVLKRAWEAHAASDRTRSPEILSIAMRTRTDHGLTIEELSEDRPTLLVFLRHAGCTFCREALSDIAAQRRELEREGVRTVLVHMSDADFGRRFFGRYGLDDLPQIANPSQTLYKAFGLQRGSLVSLLGPSVWWRGIQAAILSRHGVGPLMGDGFQMPGIFLVFHGHVLRSYRHRTSADRPDYVNFARQALNESVL